MKTTFSLTAVTLLLTTTIFCTQAFSQSADSSEIWFGPAMGSADLLQLFTSPTEWDSTRTEIDVFQFLTHHVNSWPCMGGLCNSNTLSSFIQVQAFTKLDDWGIDIAIEGAGILPQTPFGTPVDCELERQTAVQNAFNWTMDAIINVHANGGTVTYIAIDEPIRRWYSPIYPPSQGPECKTDSLAEIAAMVAEFITLMNNAAPSIVVGQIILYPELDVDGIKTYVNEIERLGIYLPFIHLDVHGLRIIDYTGPIYGRVTLAQVRADLLELETFLHAHNISFAPILIDLTPSTRLFEFGEYTDSVYYEGALDWINEVNSAMGEPDRLIFESWVRPQYSDTDLISIITPINLPENDTSIYSHTRLIGEGWTIFNPEPPGCCNHDGLRGDINYDMTINSADLIYSVGYLFKSGPAPPCEVEGDVNGDGIINTVDLLYMVGYVFKGGLPPPGCP